MSARSLPWFLLAVLALIWGSSFILIKHGLEAFSPGQLAALRIVIAALLLFPFALVQLRLTERKYWLPLALVGILGNGIPAFLFSMAETRLDSSTAGILNALSPLFVLLLGVLFFQTKISAAKIAGVMIGFGGAVALLSMGRSTGSGNLSYGLLIILATVCYATSTSIIKYRLYPLRAVQISSIAMLWIGVPYAVYLFSTNFIQVLSFHPRGWSSLGYIALLAIFGTAFSVVMFNKLIQMSGPLFAASVTYLIPVVALCWGIADGEHIGIFHAVGMAGIIAGVYLVNKRTA